MRAVPLEQNKVFVPYNVVFSSVIILCCNNDTKPIKNNFPLGFVLKNDKLILKYTRITLSHVLA